MPELLLTALAVFVLYLASCARWPYTACLVCTGGKHARSDRRVWRKCWLCHGRSQRRRFGAVLLRRG